MSKIVIVESSTGSYDDISYRTEGVFSSNELAKEYIEKAKIKIEILKNELKMPDANEDVSLENLMKYLKLKNDLDDDDYTFFISEFELDSFDGLNNFNLPEKK